MSTSRNRPRDGKGKTDTTETSRLALEEVQTAQDGLQAHVEEMRLALADKDERVKALTAEVAALRREEDRAKKNAKFDQVARDGQTKKLGILEHSLRTVRHDLQTNLERRQKLEDKTSVLERAWQNERSLRLQDLHRHESMSSDTKNAAQVAEATEGNWLAAEKRAQELESTLSGKTRELEGQLRINEAQKGENDAQAAEIELLRTDILELKRAILTREGELSKGRAITSNLRRELSRVRRDYITSTTNRSEQHSALLGGRQGSCRRSRVIPNSSSSSGSSNAFGQGQAPGGGKRIEDWATDMFSAPVKSESVSRLGSSTLRAFREGESWEDVFISRVDRIPTSTAEGGHNCLDGMGTRNEDGLVSHLPVPYARGSMKETTSMGKTTSHPARKIKPNQARPREISISTCSTLRVPGSIYVGTGLGIKKETTWVSSGGTAKEMLTKILADQHQAQDGKAVATTVHDVSPEEYD